MSISYGVSRTVSNNLKACDEDGWVGKSYKVGLGRHQRSLIRAIICKIRISSIVAGGWVYPLCSCCIRIFRVGYLREGISVLTLSMSAL